ncbi:MAG: hypothetical protein ACI9XC_000996 [Gammaproteobacteria bacterium]|jgi:hypothetical protein
MIIFKKAIQRRTFLRGLGASVALPMLDSMIPALAKPNDVAAKIPRRVGFTYTPNGIRRERWLPKTTGADFDMSDILKEWVQFKDQLLVVSNIDNGNAIKNRGHVSGCSMYMTGMEPNKSLSEVRCGTSIDQIIAAEFGKETPFSSLQICIENAAELAGQSAGGYSSAYTNTISWNSPTTPLPMEHRPREIFERLFGDAGTDPEARKSRMRRQKSILDFVQDDVSRLKKTLGANDSEKLVEYLDSLREVEFRVQKAEEKTNIVLPEMEKPLGIPAHEEHLRLMYDLMVLAFQTDMTRVFTFMLAREYSELVYTQLGHLDPYHPLTHHRGDPDRKRQAGDIDVYHAKLFGEFLAKLRATKELDGSTLLDNSLMVYGSGLGDGDSHNQSNIPMALIGGAGGNLKGGRHIAVKPGTYLNNLHVSILNKLELNTDTFGESTGELDLSAPA